MPFRDHGRRTLRFVRQKSKWQMVLLQRFDLQGNSQLCYSCLLMTHCLLLGIKRRANRGSNCLHAFLWKGWYRHSSLSSEASRAEHELGRKCTQRFDHSKVDNDTKRNDRWRRQEVLYHVIGQGAFQSHINLIHLRAGMSPRLGLWSRSSQSRWFKVEQLESEV